MAKVDVKVVLLGQQSVGKQWYPAHIADQSSYLI